MSTHQHDQGLGAAATPVAETPARAPHLVAPEPSITGYWGVQWLDERNGWLATIWGRPSHRFLGLFDNPHDAARAYNAAARERYGGAAFLNRIEGEPPAETPRGTATSEGQRSGLVVGTHPVPAASATRSGIPAAE
jgi:hypothetical protein